MCVNVLIAKEYLMETSIIRSDMLGGGRRYDVAGPNDAMVAHRDALEAKESGEEARENATLRRPGALP